MQVLPTKEYIKNLIEEINKEERIKTDAHMWRSHIRGILDFMRISGKDSIKMVVNRDDLINLLDIMEKISNE